MEDLPPEARMDVVEVWSDVRVHLRRQRQDRAQAIGLIGQHRLVALGARADQERQAGALHRSYLVHNAQGRQRGEESLRFARVRADLGRRVGEAEGVSVRPGP